LTFGVGEFGLSPKSIEMIRTKITNIFRQVCNQIKLVRQVSVVGNSDVTPQSNTDDFKGCGASEESTNKIFCNNYSLSAKRAESVYFVLRNSLLKSQFAPSEQIIECVDRKFVTQGRGPTFPNTDEGERERKWTGESSDYSSFNDDLRAKDRRVEIEILLSEAGGD
jgi:outer membrane protein OmpA-like peptidoglycan-associated protein